jgi:hypothetical protein
MRGLSPVSTTALLLAAALVCWILVIARMDGMDAGPGTDLGGLGWYLGIFAVVALLGWTMFAIWLRRRQARAGGSDIAAPGVPAEQHFPVSVVTLHGLLAVTTVVLVLLTALGVGGS